MKTKSKEKRKFGQVIKDYFAYNLPNKKPRAWELDILRGIILLVVTFDHCCFFGSSWGILPYQTEFGQKLAEISVWYCGCAFRKAVQPFGLFLLCFLSGVNSAFTRSGFRRVLKFWLFCAAYMGGFYLLHLLIPDLITAKISFNIVAVLTICFTFWWLLDLVHCPNWIRMALAIVATLAGIYGFYCHFIADETFSIENPYVAMLFYNEHGFEISRNNFEPLLPHLGFFLVGGVIGKYLYKDKKSLCKKEYPPKALYPLLIVGKHSLAVYLVMPVIILAAVRAVIEIVGLFI